MIYWFAVYSIFRETIMVIMAWIITGDIIIFLHLSVSAAQ